MPEFCKTDIHIPWKPWALRSTVQELLVTIILCNNYWT